MSTSIEIAREFAVARNNAGWVPLTGEELVERYAKQVDAVALWRAACGREAADHGFESLEHGIVFHQREEAEAVLERLEAMLAKEPVSVQVNALGAALKLLSSKAGDVWTQTARQQSHGRMMPRYAKLTAPVAAE
jgi:hypothetical protein